MAGENFISIVAKALTVLESLRGADQGLSLKEVSKTSKLPKTTAFRILFTLEQQGYVEKVSGNGCYRLSTKIMEFGVEKADHRRLKELARPVMQRLLTEFQETVNLGVIEQEEVLYIDVLESPHTFRLAAKVGARGSLHATSLGKAITAFQPEEAALAAVRGAGMAKFTDHTIVRLPDLQEELRLIRRRGYAVDEQESLDGVRCVAAPILDRDGQAVAAISVSGPSIRMTPAQVRNIAEMMIEGCSEISARLGFKKSDL